VQGRRGSKEVIADRPSCPAGLDWRKEKSIRAESMAVRLRRPADIESVLFVEGIRIAID
jgi:hypothetical protein